MAEKNATDALTAQKTRNNNILADLIIMVIILGIVAGIIIGVAAMVRYASTKYETKSIEYCLLVPVSGNESVPAVSEGQSVYLRLENGSQIEIGKVKNVRQEAVAEESINLFVTVSTDTDYKAGLGYSVEGNKIAVGIELNCRFNGYTAVCPVMALTPED